MGGLEAALLPHSTFLFLHLWHAWPAMFVVDHLDSSLFHLSQFLFVLLRLVCQRIGQAALHLGRLIPVFPQAGHSCLVSRQPPAHSAD